MILTFQGLGASIPPWRACARTQPFDTDMNGFSRPHDPKGSKAGGGTQEVDRARVLDRRCDAKHHDSLTACKLRVNKQVRLTIVISRVFVWYTALSN